MTERLRVAVLAGGPSAEHEVSLQSAQAVLDALPNDRYDPFLVVIDRQGRWSTELRKGEVDIVFPVLHGPFGEDGVVQGHLETLGLPYVGCGVMASAVAMDKTVMRRVFQADNLPTTPHVWFSDHEWSTATDRPGLVKELDYVRARIDQAAKAVMAETGIHIDYLVGTMIELPRAAIRANVIAETADFFSFGTNDLTQTTFGISRDDAATFLETYRQKGIIEQDPFVSIDIEGVGALVRLAAEKGRAARPGIKLGICGEHGGDPASIRFCEEVGLDYVSCSPFRVPIAKLAAAQAAVRGKT